MWVDEKTVFFQKNTEKLIIIYLMISRFLKKMGRTNEIVRHSIMFY